MYVCFCLDRLEPSCAGYAVPRDLATALRPPRSDALSCPPRHRLARQFAGASRSCMHVALYHVATLRLPLPACCPVSVGSTREYCRAAGCCSGVLSSALTVSAHRQHATGDNRHATHTTAALATRTSSASWHATHRLAGPSPLFTGPARGGKPSWHGLRCVLRVACCARRMLAAALVASCLLHFIIRGSPTRRPGVPTSRHTGATSARMHCRRALRTACVSRTTRSIQRATRSTTACSMRPSAVFHAARQAGDDDADGRACVLRTRRAGEPGTLYKARVLRVPPCEYSE
jgi:hypothetical protein